MDRTKTNTQKTQKHVEYQDATNIQKRKNTILCFSDFLYFFIIIMKWFLQELLTFIGGLNQFKAIAKHWNNKWDGGAIDRCSILNKILTVSMGWKRWHRQCSGDMEMWLYHV